MKKLFLIIVSLALPPASALAADLQLPFKSPAETFSWTGFYVGGNAGGAWGSERVSQTLTAPPPFLAVDTAADFIGGLADISIRQRDRRRAGRLQLSMGQLGRRRRDGFRVSRPARLQRRQLPLPEYSARRCGGTAHRIF
jgi:opacity protein-like surface antigen